MSVKKIFSILFIVFISGPVSAQGKFFGGSGDGFATATIINQVLPLVIENFEGHPEHDRVMLSFTITGDEQICGIVIEKSREGTTFTRMDSINFQSGTYTAEKFSIPDISFIPGNNYYRLRIVKCNGAFVYSKTILVYVPLNNTFFYSSADRKLYYHLAQSGTLQVYSSVGQLMMVRKLPAGSGNIFVHMPFRGLYFFRFADKPAGRFLN